MTNATGGIVEESDFYPFGGERVIVDTLDNNYKFTGHERDMESSLDYMKARHFSFSLGRFPQPDSFAFSDLGNPQSLNLYAYVLNNPLRYSDPSGHAARAQPIGLPPNDMVPDIEINFGRALQDDYEEWLIREFASANSESQQNSATSQQAQQAAGAQPPTTAAAQTTTEPQEPMTLSSEGLDFIKRQEGFSDKVYKDEAGNLTVGYGHKIKAGEDFSKGITKEQGLELLKQDAQVAVRDVNAGLKASVSQNQFDALVSFAFNAGGPAVRSENQMMRAVNAGNVTEGNFTAYRYITVEGKKVVSQGLLNRRKSEYLLYSKEVY